MLPGSSGSSLAQPESRLLELEMVTGQLRNSMVAWTALLLSLQLME